MTGRSYRIRDEDMLSITLAPTNPAFPTPSPASWARGEISLASILHPMHEPLSKRPTSAVSSRQYPPMKGYDSPILLPVDQESCIVETFFQYVRPIIPIFHEPTFHITHLQSSYHKMHMYAMACLAFRYLPIEIQSLSISQHRVSADTYWFAALELIEREVATPSLQVLQALALVTLYEISRKVTSREYQRVGLCVRIAYDLELNAVDAGKWSSDPETWIRQEEKRRLWWSIWEMETFMGNVYQRPVFASQAEIQTFLPANEGRWYSNDPEMSVHLHRDPQHRWLLLKEGKKTDPRSFFLVAVSMMLFTAQLGSKRTYYEEIEPLAQAITSFEEIMPPELKYQGTLAFRDETMFNDIICANSYITMQW